MSATVVVRDLHKRYGAVAAVRGVSFEVAAGEIFGLLGPNGAGKTTTLECLIGLRDADAGELLVGGIDVRRDPREARQAIGVALQQTSLPDKITPREALRLFGSFYRERAEPAALLERFALTDKADAPFDTLSGGQRQRLALALAFVNRPHVVLLDEPTTGLDPQARRELHAEIRQMKAEGYTVLLTTHYLAEAEALCDRLAIIAGGRAVATGRPADLVARAGVRQTVTVTTAPLIAAAAWARLPGAKDVQVAATGTVTLATERPTETVAAVAALVAEHRAELVDLTVRKATLEEVFVGLTQAAEDAA